MGWSPTVAHASGSERFVLFPWLISASAYSSFRVIPCSSVAMLMLGFPSVANLMLIHSSTSGFTSAAR